MTAMWISEGAFRRGLHEEHHDELAFLYGQTTRLRDEGELPLAQLAEFERRLAAHLDALSIGGAAAWRDIGLVHDDGEPGHWYAASLLACVQGEDRRLRALLERVRHLEAPEAAEAAAAALADALRHAMPTRWDELLRGWLAEMPQPLLGHLAAVASFRGPACRDVLERRVAQGCPPSVELLRALGRCGAAASTPWLLQQVEGAPVPGSAVGVAAWQALCELGAPQGLARLRARAEYDCAVHPVLATVGGRTDAQLLLRRLAAAAAPETALALGLLGELSAVRTLVALLDHDAAGEAAATALHWITGAGLSTTVFEPDDDEPHVDKTNGDEAAAAPYARLRPGAALARRPGTEVQRLARDPARWSAWLAEAAPRFRPGTRYRLGHEYSVPWLLETLSAGGHGGVYRRLAADELAARHAPRAGSTCEARPPAT